MALMLPGTFKISFSVWVIKGLNTIKHEIIYQIVLKKIIQKSTSYIFGSELSETNNEPTFLNFWHQKIVYSTQSQYQNCSFIIYFFEIINPIRNHQSH